MPGVDPRLLELLACPNPEHAPLEMSDETLRCPVCAVAYPVDGVVPILIPRQASGPPAAPSDKPTAKAQPVEPGGVGVWRPVVRLYRWYRFYSSPTRPVIRGVLRKHLSVQMPRTVLEVGGGTSMLRRYFPAETQFVSVDIAPTEKTDVVSDGQALAFQSAAFDMCVAYEVIEHVPDTDKFISEIARCVERDGYLMLSFPFMYGRHDFVDYYRFTVEGISTILSRHGFEVEVVRKVGGTFHTTSVMFSNWVRSRIFVSRSWRAGAKDRGRLLVSELIVAPLMPVVWFSYVLDALLDRDSASPTGLVVIARRGTPVHR